MSLVNLSYVCSHLLNASRARLPIASIVPSKLNLAIALQLHKAGFVSSVTLGGLTPPDASSSPLLSHPPVPPPERRRGWRQPPPASALQPSLPTSAGPVAWQEWQSANPDLTPITIYETEARSTANEESSIPSESHTTPNSPDSRRHYAKLSLLQRVNASNILHLYDAAAEASSTFGRRFGAPPELEELVSAVTEIEAFPFDVGADSTAAAAAAAAASEASTLDSSPDLAFSGQNPPIHPISGPRPVEDLFALPDDVTQSTTRVEVPASPAERRLWLGLKYWANKPVMTHFSLVSKPKRRIWMSREDLGALMRGRRAGYVDGIRQIGECVFVSTDRGIMELRECVRRGVGGMLLCRVW